MKIEVVITQLGKVVIMEVSPNNTIDEIIRRITNEYSGMDRESYVIKLGETVLGRKKLVSEVNLKDGETVKLVPLEASKCPIFQNSLCKSSVEDELKNNEYFVAHSFVKEEMDDLRSAIREALDGYQLEPYYADNELRQAHILCKICEKIRKTRFGIYDVSGEKSTGRPNPNVTLELGMAYGFGQKVILIARKGSKLSDISGIDRIEYQSYKELTKELKKKIDGFLKSTS